MKSLRDLPCATRAGARHDRPPARRRPRRPDPGRRARHGRAGPRPLSRSERGAPGAGPPPGAELAPRRARTGDARAFAALSRSEIERGLPHAWTAPRIARLLARPDTNAYALADARGGIGGFTIASFGATRAHLVLHAVTPGLRRAGFGTLLLDWQVRAGLVAGIESFGLEVRAGDAAAIRFYRASGFEPGERVPGYYAHREDALRMRLAPLRPAGGSSGDPSGGPSRGPSRGPSPDTGAPLA